MKRIVLVAAVVPLLLALATGPAQAKGGHGEEITGMAVITGPGLEEPIELTGDVTVFEGQPTGAAADMSTLLTSAGIFSNGTVGWYELEPDLSAIGPRYQVRYRMTGDGWKTTYVQDLYPFAPDRPLFHTPPATAKQLLGRSVGLWWSAPSPVLSLLRARGLPLTPPAGQAPPPVADPEAPAPVPSADPSRAWIILGASLGLMGLALAGALTGRPRRRTLGALPG